MSVSSSERPASGLGVLATEAGVLLGDGGWLVLAVGSGTLNGPGMRSGSGASVCWVWSVMVGIDRPQKLLGKRLMSDENAVMELGLVTYAKGNMEQVRWVTGYELENLSTVAV